MQDKALLLSLKALGYICVHELIRERDEISFCDYIHTLDHKCGTVL